MKMANMKKSETTEQIRLFTWASNRVDIYKELGLMYHIPNEGKRENGAILKMAGLKRGVPDICLPVNAGKYNALYIELKHGNGKATKQQNEFIELLNKQGNKAVICYGFEEARKEILEYLSLKHGYNVEYCEEAPKIAGFCEGKEEQCKECIMGKIKVLEERCKECTKNENGTCKKYGKKIHDVFYCDLIELL